MKVIIELSPRELGLISYALGAAFKEIGLEISFELVQKFQIAALEAEGLRTTSCPNGGLR